MAPTASLRLSDGGLPIDWGKIPFFRPVFLLFDVLAQQPQFGAIWCNLVQFSAIPRRELQSGCGRIALAFVKIAPDGIALPAWDGDGASL
jgi:hypothetical protein